MGDFVVQECCVHGTDLESHGPTSILCDDPLPLLTTGYVDPGYKWFTPNCLYGFCHSLVVNSMNCER